MAALAGVLVLAALLRTSYLIEATHDPEFIAPRFDAGYHDYWARGLATDDWTPPPYRPDPDIRHTPFFRPPGYPYFLALIVSLVHGNALWIRALQMAVGLVDCVLAFLLGRRLFGERIGLIYAGFMSFYWSFIYYEAQLLEPVLLVPLSLGLFLLIARWQESFRMFHVFLAGLVTGIYALVRPNILLFAPVALLWFWAVARSRKESRSGQVRVAGLYLAGLLLAVSPATVRNLLAGHDLVLISSNSGVNLYIGNNEAADGVSASGPETGAWTCFEYPQIVARISREQGRPLRHSEVSRLFAQKAARYAANHLSRTVHLTIKKALLFWGPYEVSNNKEDEIERSHSRVLRRLVVRFPMVLSLCITGVIMLLRDVKSGRSYPPGAAAPVRIRTAFFILLFIFSIFASYLPFFVAGRYRVPVVPALLLFSSYGLDGLMRLAWAGRIRKLAWLLLLTAASWFLVSSNFAGYLPNPFNYHFLKASAYVCSDRLELGLAEFRRCLDINPHDLAAQANMASALIELGQLEEAERICRNSLLAEQADPQIHYNMGLVLFKQGRYSEATTHFREALKYRPDYGPAHYYLGSSLASQDMIDQAIYHLSKAATISPQDPKVLLSLGYALATRGDAQDAIRQFAKAVAMAPDMRRQIENIKPVPQEKSQASALIHYTYLLWTAPSAEVHCALARSLLAAGRSGAALSQYNSALEIEPQSPAHLNNLAWVHATRGEVSQTDTEEALKLALRACSLTSYQDPSCLDTLAAAHASAGDYAEAVRVAEKARTLAQSQGRTNLMHDIETHADLYGRQTPLRSETF